MRALGLVALAVWSAARDKSALTLLSARWDSLWYTRVAELGYGYEVRLPNGDVHSNLAFFPLLPWLERAVSAVTPLSYAHAGLVVGTLASLAAAWGIFAVADQVYGRRVGVCAVLLWAVLPVGVVQSMAYTESLFTALAAWSLYAVLTGRWVTAGTLAALAGLTRPVGLAVVAAVWAAAIASYLRERRHAPAPRSYGTGVRRYRTALTSGRAPSACFSHPWVPPAMSCGSAVAPARARWAISTSRRVGATASTAATPSRASSPTSSRRSRRLSRVSD